MDWLFVWKVVVAAAVIVVTINYATVAAKATRDAIHHWKAPREMSK